MFPKLLQPNGTEDFIISGRTVQIPKYTIQFKKWEGIELKETFGNKPVINMNGKPMFAELAIMNLFLQSGWQTIWVETYARLNKEPFYMSDWDFEKRYKDQINTPIKEKKILMMLAEIAKRNNNSYGGCWDVLGWNGKQILFAESKRFKKDRIQSTQNRWLEAGLKYGLRLENFMVVQWNFK
jgi:hypothetical protein